MSELGSGLDGRSTVALLKNPSLKWERPGLSTCEPDCHALHSERWGYNRYKDGS